MLSEATDTVEPTLSRLRSIPSSRDTCLPALSPAFRVHKRLQGGLQQPEPPPSLPHCFLPFFHLPYSVRKTRKLRRETHCQPPPSVELKKPHFWVCFSDLLHFRQRRNLKSLAWACVCNSNISPFISLSSRILMISPPSPYLLCLDDSRDRNIYSCHLCTYSWVLPG